MPVLQGRAVCFVLEQLVERLGAFEAQLVGDGGHGPIGFCQVVPGFVNQFFVNQLLGRLAGKGAQHITQIAGRKVYLGGEVFYRG